MKKDVKRGIGHYILYFSLPAIIFVIWEWADIAGILKPYTMPAPMAILNTFFEYLKNGRLLTDIGVSLVRVVEGFLLAFAAAFVIGIGASVSPWFDTFTDLVIQILRPIPPIAWIPLAILWFGIGQGSKVFIIFLGAFFPIFINTTEGVKNIDGKFFELAEVYEMPKQKLITKIVIPGAHWEAVTIGGQTKEGYDATNELTYILLKSKREFPLNYPDLAARIHTRSPKRYLYEVAETIKAGEGFPKLLNDEDVIPLLLS